MGKLSINELADLAGVSIKRIHSYESKGVLSEPNRDRNNQMQYSMDAIRRIKFIRRCESVGFSLDEIDELMRLRTNKTMNCRDVKEKVTDSVAAVNQKINDLIQIRDALGRMLIKCDDNSLSGECPILEELKQY
jgi:DNA-binding transcriptional MerR regulator